MQHLKTGIIFLLCSFVFSAFVFSQDTSIVSWKAETKKVSAAQYELLLKGTIKKGWHVYDSNAAHELTGVLSSIEDSSFNAGAIQFLTKSKGQPDLVFENKPMQVTADSIVFSQKINITGRVPAAVKIKLNYEVGNADNFLPEEQNVTINLQGGVAAVTINRILISSINLDKPLTDCGASSSASSGTKSKGLLSLFVLGFAIGKLT